MKIQGLNSRNMFFTIGAILLLIVGLLIVSTLSIPSARAADGENLVASNQHQSQGLQRQANLSLNLALAGATAAVEACTSDGYRVSVAVVDASGVSQVQLRSDGAGPHTLGSSDGKAYTAASLRRATLGLANFVGTRPDLEGLRDMDDRILILGGGLPIEIDGVVVGGIGVGGAPGGDLDEACAQAGIDRIHDIINRDGRDSAND